VVPGKRTIAFVTDRPGDAGAATDVHPGSVEPEFGDIKHFTVSTEGCRGITQNS